MRQSRDFRFGGRAPLEDRDVRGMVMIDGCLALLENPGEQTAAVTGDRKEREALVRRELEPLRFRAAALDDPLVIIPMSLADQDEVSRRG